MGQLLLALMVGATPLSPAEVYKRAAPSVVFLVSRVDEQHVSQGSGIVLSPRTILTNWHVVDAASLVLVKSAPAPGRETGEVGVAILVAENAARDLAILHLLNFRLEGEALVPGAPSLQKVKVASADVEVGQRVFAIGSPRGLELSLSDGLVSQLRTTASGRMIQTTAAISHGSSGGGLFNADAELVGLTTSSLEDGQALNFAVPAKDALPLASGGFSERGARRFCGLPKDLQAEVLSGVDERSLRTLRRLLAKSPCEDESAPEEYFPSVSPSPKPSTQPSGPQRPPSATAPPPVVEGPNSSQPPQERVPTTVVVDSAPEAATEGLRPPPEPPLVTATPRVDRGLAWLPAAAGAALLASGGVFYGLARGVEADLRNPATKIGSETEAERVALTGRTYQTASAILLVAGAASAVTAVAMFALLPAANEATVSAQVLPDGFCVAVRGVFP